MKEVFGVICILLGFIIGIAATAKLDEISGRLTDIRAIDSEARDGINCLAYPGGRLNGCGGRINN